MTTDQIHQTLANHFVGAQIEVIDMTGGSDHIQVYIKSPLFEGKSRIQRHRMVMDLFSSELNSGEIHALSIQAEV